MNLIRGHKCGAKTKSLECGPAAKGFQVACDVLSGLPFISCVISKTSLTGVVITSGIDCPHAEQEPHRFVLFAPHLSFAIHSICLIKNEQGIRLTKVMNRQEERGKEDEGKGKLRRDKE